MSDHSGERIFHCTEDSAHKFWRVRVEGNTQEVHFGRIGAIGQTRSKSFASPEETETATAVLIARKLARGYVEVTGDQAARTAPKPVAQRRPRPVPRQQLLLPFEPVSDAAALPTLSAVPVGPPAVPALAFDL